MSKKFMKKLAFLMALVVALSSLMLVGCGEKGTEEEQSTKDEAAATVGETYVEVPDPDFATIRKTYKPAEAFDLTGKSVPLETIFGQGYAKYGDELVFNEDGTFTMYIGVTGNPDSVKGRYKTLSTTEIELQFDNDTKKIAVITATDLEFNAVEIRVPYLKDYNVIFR